MDITYNELLGMHISLVDLINNNEFAISTNRKLKKIYKEVDEEVKILDDLKKDILKKYCELDKNGEVKIITDKKSEKPIFKSNEDNVLCDKEIEELANTVTDVNIDKYRISETDFSHIKLSYIAQINLEPILIFNDELEEN